MPQCEYCLGYWFIRNLRGGLECAGCGSSAPFGATELTHFNNNQSGFYIIKVNGLISHEIAHALKENFRRATGLNNFIVIDERISGVDFVGGK